jgi:hypothetical protein
LSKECLMVVLWKCIWKLWTNTYCVWKSRTTLFIVGYWSKLHFSSFLQQTGSSMDREIFENWFHIHFFLEVTAFLKETGLPQKQCCC